MNLIPGRPLGRPINLPCLARDSSYAGSFSRRSDSHAFFWKVTTVPSLPQNCLAEQFADSLLWQSVWAPVPRITCALRRSPTMDRLTGWEKWWKHKDRYGTWNHMPDPSIVADMKRISQPDLTDWYVQRYSSKHNFGLFRLSPTYCVRGEAKKVRKNNIPHLAFSYYWRSNSRSVQ